MNSSAIPVYARIIISDCIPVDPDLVAILESAFPKYDVETIDNHIKSVRAAVSLDCPVVCLLIVGRTQRNEILEVLRIADLSNEEDGIPRVLVLIAFDGAHPEEWSTEYARRGAELSFGQYPKDIISRIRKLLMGYPTELEPVTFEISYDEVGLKIVLVGRIKRMELDADPKIKELFEIFATIRRWISRRKLAEMLGVSLNTPKEYVKRFRDAYDGIRVEAGESTPGKQVLRSEIGLEHRYRLFAKIIKK